MKSFKLAKIILFIIPLSLVFYLFNPKPAPVKYTPPVQSVSLADSIPVEYYRQLIVVEKQGKMLYENGRRITYLEYETEADKLLKTIASLPFSKHAVRADTVCIETGFYNFEAIRNSLSDTESTAGGFFWNANLQNYQVFECVKGNEKHILLINRFSDQVLHRIELTA